MAKEFDGAELIAIPAPNVGATNGYTVAAWVRPDAVSSRAIFSYGNGNAAANPRGWMLRIDGSSKAEFRAGISGGEQQVIGTTSLATGGAWYFLVGVRDSGAGAQLLRIYVNGTQENTNNTDPTVVQSSTDDFRIAAPPTEDNTGSSNLDGGIAYVAFWHTVLSGAEIISLAAGGDPKTTQSASLRIYVDFAESMRQLDLVIPRTQLEVCGF